jgi:hypothetical protein
MSLYPSFKVRGWQKRHLNTSASINQLAIVQFKASPDTSARLGNHILDAVLKRKAWFLGYNSSSINTNIRSSITVANTSIQLQPHTTHHKRYKPQSPKWLLQAPAVERAGRVVSGTSQAGHDCSSSSSQLTFL